MKLAHADLPRYTRQQAEALNLWHSQAFGTALGIQPWQIRRWAQQGHIKPQGIGPNGQVLYNLADVTRHADSTTCENKQSPAQ